MEETRELRTRAQVATAFRSLLAEDTTQGQVLLGHNVLFMEVESAIRGAPTEDAEKKNRLSILTN